MVPRAVTVSVTPSVAPNEANVDVEATLTTLLSRDRFDAEFVSNVSGGVVSPQGDVFAFSTQGS